MQNSVMTRPIFNSPTCACESPTPVSEEMAVFSLTQGVFLPLRVKKIFGTT